MSPIPFPTRSLRGLALVVLSAAAGLLQAAPAPEVAAPKFTYRLKKPAEDAVRVSLDKDGAATFHVTSKSGIGAAEMILAEGNWPNRITLQLGLGSLEHFAVGNGKVILQGSLRARPKTVLYYSKNGTAVKDPAQAAYTVTIVQKGRQIEVTLPPGFATKDTKKLELDWIDAYRV